MLRTSSANAASPPLSAGTCFCTVLFDTGARAPGRCRFEDVRRGWDGAEPQVKGDTLAYGEGPSCRGLE